MDSNSGLANRTAFDETLEREIGRAIEARQTLSILMIEIDFFESFYELLGDKAAEECIILLSKCLFDIAMRPGDLPAIFSGGTFAMILPDTSSEVAAQSANRLLEAIEALDIIHPSSAVSHHVTCSIGIANCSNWECPVDHARTAVGSDDQLLISRCTSETLQTEARFALEQAKRMGYAQSYGPN